LGFHPLKGCKSICAHRRTTTLKKPAKKTAKKAVKKAKPAVKAKAKPVAKKAATRRVPSKKTILKKATAKKATTKKSVSKKLVAKKKPATAKAPPRKSLGAKKPVAKKPVAKKSAVAKTAPRNTFTAKKSVAAKTQTKTAERKARRAAKGVVAPVAVAQPVTPTWSPLIAALLVQLDDAKAEAVIAMDLREKSTIADTMVVATGRSSRHVNAIADQVVEELGKHGLKNIRIEGVPQCDWVLVDAGDVIVHVFRPEVRSFYNLEKLWAANIPE
jgi:ribosome-associated protein